MQLKNYLYQKNFDPFEPGNWEYKGKWYFNISELYIAILAYELADQFGITDVSSLIMILSGQPLLPKRFNTPGATKGTSFASKYLSKIPGQLPLGFPTITNSGIRFTKSIGRIAGRAIPIIGWGLLATDVAIILYKTQIEFERILNNYNE